MENNNNEQSVTITPEMAKVGEELFNEFIKKFNENKYQPLEGLAVLSLVSGNLCANIDQALNMRAGTTAKDFQSTDLTLGVADQN